MFEQTSGTNKAISKKRQLGDIDVLHVQESSRKVIVQTESTVTKKRKTNEVYTNDDIEAARSLCTRMLNGVDPEWASIISDIAEQLQYRPFLRYNSNITNKSITILPAVDEIMQAFRLTSFNDVKVVILGQDPYHNLSQAMGLAFSVRKDVKLPPSLSRIFTEAGVKNCKQGDLTSWATQGVLLLNCTLTVELHKPGSHHSWGWSKLTDEIIRRLSSSITDRSLIFMLWGNKAIEKKYLVDTTLHQMLEASHPSPLATKGNFIGCNHFSQANELLLAQKRHPIRWDSVLGDGLSADSHMRMMATCESTPPTEADSSALSAPAKEGSLSIENQSVLKTISVYALRPEL